MFFFFVVKLLAGPVSEGHVVSVWKKRFAIREQSIKRSYTLVGYRVCICVEKHFFQNDPKCSFMVGHHTNLNFRHCPIYTKHLFVEG